MMCGFRPVKMLNITFLATALFLSALSSSSEASNLAEDTFKFITAGEKKMNFQGTEDFIVTLGTTGTGKSTLIHFIAGDNSKLIVKKRGRDLIFDDGDKKIGSTTIQSKTLFPETTVDKLTGQVFVDCPGFSDTRSTSLEIASSYFIKNVLDQAARVKFILTISHMSVRVGYERLGMLNLLRHISHVIRDVDKFTNSFVLVVTKVDNAFPFVEDSEEISYILEFLVECKESIEDKILNTDSTLTVAETEENKNMLKIINILLESNGSRIGLFRRPDKEGKVSESIFMQDGKHKLREIILFKTRFSSCNRNDFEAVLSPASLLLIKEQLLASVDDKIVANIEILKHNLLISFHRKYSERFNLTDTTLADSFSFLQKIENEADLKTAFLYSIHFIDTSFYNSDIITEILGLIKQLEFYRTITKNQNNINYIENYATLMKQFADYTSFINNWQNGLNNLQIALAKQNVQSRRSYFKSKFNNNITHEVLTKFLFSASDELALNDSQIVANEIIKQNHVVTEYMLTELNEILKIYLHSFSHECSDGELKIEGLIILSQDVLDLRQSQCKGMNITTISIYALSTVFIDADLNFIGEEIQLHIVAPKWVVIGKRNIILDGKEGAIQKPARSDMLHVKDGNPGNPGVNAGTFLGFALEIEQSKNLFISVNGGKGGPGQTGGNGLNGKDSPVPFTRGNQGTSYGAYMDYGVVTIKTITGKWGVVSFIVKVMGFTVKEVSSSDSKNSKERSFIVFVDKDSTYDKRLEVTNSDGWVAPSNGGNGGVGGKGGHEGQVLIFSFYPNKVRVSNKTGDEGTPGLGGPGGIGRHRSTSIFYKCKVTGHKEYFFGFEMEDDSDNHHCTLDWSEQPKYQNIMPNGSPGLPGINKIGLHKADVKPLRKTIQGLILSFTQITLQNFISMKQENNVVSSLLRFLYNDRNIVKHFKITDYLKVFAQLETHFFSPRYNNSLFLEHCEIVAESLKIAKTIDIENQGFIYKYIKTALFTKLFQLKSIDNNMIINLHQYIDHTVDIFNSIKDNSELNSLYDDKYMYESKINAMINEVQAFMEKNIESEVSNIKNDFNKGIHQLINELIHLKENVIHNKNQLIDKEKEIMNKIKKERKSNVIRNIFTSVVSFFMDSSFLSAIKLFTVGNRDEQFPVEMPKPSVLVNLKTGFQNVVGKITGADERITQYISNFENILKSTARISQYIPAVHERTNKFVSKVSELRNKYTKFTEIKDLLRQVQGILDETENAISSLNESVTETFREETEKSKLAIKTFKDNLNLPLFINKNIGDKNYNSEEINVIRDAIVNSDQELEKIDEFENKIHEFLEPLLDKMFDDVDNISKSLESQSSVSLKISEWKMKTYLAGIRHLLTLFVEQFKVKGEMLMFIARLEELIYLQINLFEKIQNYEEQKVLANYIHKLNSPNLYNKVINNSELSFEFNKLKIIIQSNILFSRYSKIKSSFKQLMFPFGNSHLQVLNLANFNPNLHNSSIVTLTAVTVDNIRYIKNVLNKIQTNIEGGKDSITYVREFNSKFKSGNPFYVWDNENHNKEIQALFSGEEIFLTAKVSNSDKMNAVKFKLIELNIKAINKDLQSNLTNILSLFDVELTHLGDSYYKCGAQYYVIHSVSLTIVHSFERDVMGEPVSKNNVYMKIRNGDIFLSPYAIWSLKLVNKKASSFDVLRAYSNLVDLELVGKGQYVSESAEICSTSLQDHYEVYEDISSNVINNFS